MVFKTYTEAIYEATDACMSQDEDVCVIGLGVTDPKGIFGTTLGLEKRYGSNRVFDTPTAENAVTGIALGASLIGMRPIITHQRVEFSLLGIEQMVNQAAKWHYQTAGKMKAPLVFRLIIGRGWGQGPQHSQSLESWFAHIPGLKVVMPSSPADAKGLLIASIWDDNPVVFIEHRWLHFTKGNVPTDNTPTQIGKSKIARQGSDLTIVAYSYMVSQALYVAEVLSEFNISIEVLDLRSLRPLDEDGVLLSVSKTKRVLVLDIGWSKCGIASEIITLIALNLHSQLSSAPKRLGLKDIPIPSTRSLANNAYPSLLDIIDACQSILGVEMKIDPSKIIPNSDVPNEAFKGPF